MSRTNSDMVINKLELSYINPDYCHKRQLQIDTPAWKALREIILKRDAQTCRFCGIKSFKYMVVDHLDGNAMNNSLSNLGVNCQSCDTIRHCELGTERGHLIIGNSSLTQLEIVKRTQNFYISNRRIPFPEEIDISYEKTR